MTKPMSLLSRYRLILILLLGCLLAVLLLNEHLVPAGDNATYIILGQSLVTGRGFRMISDSRQPEMALYPPGYPLLLAGVLALTHTAHNLTAAILPMKILSVVLYLAAIALAYELFKQRNPILAIITALLMAVNPHILYFATEVGTEIPYLFLSLGCLWLFASPHRQAGTSGGQERRRPQWFELLRVAVLLALTFYVRSIALVMVVAFVLYFAAQRRFQHALLFLVVVGLLTAPWFIHSSSLPATGTSVGLGRGYFALYFSSDPYGTERASVSDWTARLTQNLRIYALDIWPEVLFPHALRVSSLFGPLRMVFTGALALLLLLGFVLEARHWWVSEWYVALFFMSCVGYLWAQSRLIVPIIPFALYYFLVALSFLLERVTSHALHVTATIAMVSAGLMLSALIADVRYIQQNLRYGLGQPVATYYAADSEWSNYLQAMNWIASDAKEPTVVMCRKADLLYILTGLRALEYPYSTDGVMLMQFAQENHVAYIIEDAFTWTRTTQQYLQPALRAWQVTQPATLALTYETAAPHTRVWRIQN